LADARGDGISFLTYRNGPEKGKRPKQQHKRGGGWQSCLRRIHDEKREWVKNVSLRMEANLPKKLRQVVSATASASNGKQQRSGKKKIDELNLEGAGGRFLSRKDLGGEQRVANSFQARGHEVREGGASPGGIFEGTLGKEPGRSERGSRRTGAGTRA